MQRSKRIVVIAGEESGDFHAATFIRDLKSRHQHLEISGIGGKHMADAGVHLISDLARFGVTGVSEVVKHFRVIRRAFLDIKAHLTTQKPDLLILVDYPGFNLRLAKFAKKNLNLRILYYISPQIWAWKANRIDTIRAYVDKMAVILPFEKTLYQRAGIPVDFVGHPLVSSVSDCKDIVATRKQLKLPPHHRIIALLPGSRVHEIERHMPILRDVAIKLSSQDKTLHLAIPVAKTIDKSLIESYLSHTNLSYSLIEDNAVATAACSDYVIVASGTASLECALLKKPMCIIYKTSWITSIAAAQLIRVRYLGLCNILQNQMIVPELLHYDCNVIELSRVMLELMKNQETTKRMIKELHLLKESLSTQKADMTISALIEQEWS